MEKNKEEKDGSNILKGILIATSICIFIIVAAFLIKALTNPVPNPLTKEEMDNDLRFLSSSIWIIDQGSRKKLLEEFSLSPIKEIHFLNINELDQLEVILITDRLGFDGFVERGEKCLKLFVDGFSLDIWYSGNEESDIRSLTVNGKSDYLVFVRK